MTPTPPGLSLQTGFARSGLSYQQLWLRQLSIGGSADQLEVEAYLHGLLTPDPYQHDLLAHALNEHFSDHDQNHPVAYWDTAAAP